MIQNSYLELQASRVKEGCDYIREVEEEEEKEDSYIDIQYLKSSKEKHNNFLLSLYKKQTKSSHSVIIKNQTRQIITHLTTSRHYNTLVTY